MPQVVSIPFTPGNSFLLPQSALIKCAELCMCQSPSHRGTHFYADGYEKTIAPEDVVCQSPSHRGTHFYILKTGAGVEEKGRVNPLHIGELISTLTLIFC